MWTQLCSFDRELSEAQGEGFQPPALPNGPIPASHTSLFPALNGRIRFRFQFPLGGMLLFMAEESLHVKCKEETSELVHQLGRY